MLLNFPNRIRRLIRCDMHATAWSCLSTLRDFMSLHRSGTSFFGLHASFKNLKSPIFTRQAQPHQHLTSTRKASPVPNLSSCTTLHRSNLRFWPTKTFGEKPEWSTPSILCWFYSFFFFFFFLLSMVKLMKQPIYVQNCLGHSVPTPKRKETAHIKTQNVTLTTAIPGEPVSQGFLLWISCRTGCYVCGPPRDSKIRE